jgi:multiple antibiotic resistance protein
MPDWSVIRGFIESCVSIFVIVNPIGNLPLLVGLTEGESPARRRRVFRLAGLTALVILSVFAVAGKLLLRNVFHITLPEFTFGGGLLLVIIGTRNVVLGPGGARSPRPRSDLPPSEEEELTLAVSPIAFPLLVGPGSIITVMLIVDRYGPLYAVLACATTFLFVMAVLEWAPALLRSIGRLGAMAVGRVLQIFIIAIGAHFIFEALSKAFPAWVGH